MSVDVVVAVPAFLDMTFVGLEGLPGLGEERFAGDLVRSPGGGAITAIGAARLGLSTALAAPLGGDPAGDVVRGVMDEEGVQVVGPTCPRTPITMVMPIEGERADGAQFIAVHSRSTCLPPSPRSSASVRFCTSTRSGFTTRSPIGLSCPGSLPSRR